jgi:hypothetical protein
MKLPNADRALVDIAKLEEYCLNPDHPRGRHKARVFASALGLTKEHAEELKQAILDSARIVEAQIGEVDEYGHRYLVDFMMIGPSGECTVRSAWIVRTGEEFPRLTTCYVL